MKRSEINAIIEDAIRFSGDMNFRLPPFAAFSPAQWRGKGEEYREIADNMLGWDITDFGSGNYEKVGLLMFTLRNGSLHNPAYTKPYAEKLLIALEEQVTPYHFHWNKMEDIINRGGGNLVIRMYNRTQDERLADTDVQVHMDGRTFTCRAGEELILHPGESITIHPGQYHSFWGEKGKGRVLVGEVSKVNDDTVDNRFLEPTGRFPEIEEDEEARFLLYTDYCSGPYAWLD